MKPLFSQQQFTAGKTLEGTHESYKFLTRLSVLPERFNLEETAILLQCSGLRRLLAFVFSYTCLFQIRRGFLLPFVDGGSVLGIPGCDNLSLQNGGRSDYSQYLQRQVRDSPLTSGLTPRV